MPELTRFPAAKAQHITACDQYERRVTSCGYLDDGVKAFDSLRQA